MDLREAKFLRRVFKRAWQTEGDDEARSQLQRLRAELKGIARDRTRKLRSPARSKAIRRSSRWMIEVGL